MTRGTYATHITWMLMTLVVVIFLCIMRGPLHEAVWADDCAALARGEAVQMDYEGQQIRC